MNEEYSQVLDVAALAGHILLENGAEISRVEDTMNRISSHYGVNSVNFFVLSNGIFTTGPSGYGKSGRYANVEFIPIKGVQLDKVSAVSALSYDICSDKYNLEEAWVFPLVPGAGVFWTTYYLASKQFHLSLGSGWTAFTAAGAIVLGIIVAMEVPQKFFKLFKRK